MRSSIALILTLSIHAEGTAPKPAATDYPVTTRFGDTAIAADFMIHSISGEGQTFFVEDYLVVEVAIYPDKFKEIAVANTQFVLRLNGKRTLVTQTPQFVAASLKYPDWERRPTLVGQAGPIIVGRPQQVERFPGDPTVGQGRLPEQPRVPSQLPSSRAETPKAQDIALEMALPEGTHKHPVSGYIYFPYKGKLKGLKTIELVVKSGPNEAVLKLR